MILEGWLGCLKKFRKIFEVTKDASGTAPQKGPHPPDGCIVRHIGRNRIERNGICENGICGNRVGRNMIGRRHIGRNIMWMN